MIPLLAIWIDLGSVAAEVAQLTTRSGEVRRGTAEFSTAGLSIREAGGRVTSVSPAELKAISFDRHPVEGIERKPDERSGLEARYYTNSLFEGQPFSAVVPAIEHDSSLRLRALASSPDGLSVRWVAHLIPPAEGLYRFTLRSKGPARLWVQANCVGCIRSNDVLRESIGQCFLRGGERAAFIVEQSAGKLEDVPQIRWGSSEVLHGPISPRCFVQPAGADLVSEITHGLLVTYYGNARFESRRLMRVERGIKARWEGQPPFAELGLGWMFSAVWEGTLAVPTSGSFRLAVDAEGGFQVTLNERPTLRRWSDKKGDPADLASFPVFLDADRTYPIKVEYFNEYAPGRIRAYWYPSQGLQSPDFERRLMPADPPDFSMPVDSSNAGGTIDEGLEGAFVVLTDGSRTPQKPVTATRSQVHLSAGALPTQLPLDLVARLQLSPLPLSARLQNEVRRSGILMHNGDFLEGDLQSMDADEIRLSSILLGNHRVRRDQVCAVYLRPLRASLPEWEVLSVDGGAYRAQGVSFAPRAVTLKGFSTGALELPQERVLRISSQSK